MTNMVNIFNMTKENKDQRITLMMDLTLLERIDSLRFLRRIGSRAEAMRQLMIEALDATETKTATTEPARAE